MQEIEIKVRVNNLQEAQLAFETLGCVFSASKSQKDRIYIPEASTFPHLRKGDCALRLRTVEQWSTTTHLFTLKQKTANGLAKIEKETKIDDPEQMHEAILLLGYKEVSRVQKSRKSCVYKNMTICLDEVAELGSFVEIEMMWDAPEQLQAEMMTFLTQLGVHYLERITVGYDILMFQRGVN